jgi:hypothetical protein
MRCNAVEGDERWCCPSNFVFDGNTQSCIEKTPDMNLKCSDVCPPGFKEGLFNIFYNCVYIAEIGGGKDDVFFILRSDSYTVIQNDFFKEIAIIINTPSSPGR